MEIVSDHASLVQQNVQVVLTLAALLTFLLVFLLGDQLCTQVGQTARVSVPIRTADSNEAHFGIFFFCVTVCSYELLAPVPIGDLSVMVRQACLTEHCLLLEASRWQPC